MRRAATLHAERVAHGKMVQETNSFDAQLFLFTILSLGRLRSASETRPHNLLISAVTNWYSLRGQRSSTMVLTSALTQTVWFVPTHKMATKNWHRCLSEY